MVGDNREHLAQIYIVGNESDGRRSRLRFACSRCSDPEVFKTGITVAEVIQASIAHVERIDGGGAADEQTVGQAAAVAKLYSLAVLDEARSAAGKFLADLEDIRRRYERELSAGPDQFKNLLALAKAVEKGAA